MAQVPSRSGNNYCRLQVVAAHNGDRMVSKQVKYNGRLRTTTTTTTGRQRANHSRRLRASRSRLKSSQRATRAISIGPRRRDDSTVDGRTPVWLMPARFRHVRKRHLEAQAKMKKRMKTSNELQK